MSDELLKQECFVDGRWIKADSKKSLSVLNPANGSVVGTIPNCAEAETARAIESSQRAFAEWRTVSAEDRSKVLGTVAQLLRDHTKELSRILTLEQGKPLSESEKEIAYAANYIVWYAEEARRVYGETIPAASKQRILVLHEPVGVCAGITPWNFPIAMIARKMGAALAAGCSFIAKPAKETPLSALALAALCDRASLPPGVFNIITGDAEPIARTLMQSAVVQKLSFTGSTEIGKKLIEQSGATVKKLTLELGGNAPFLVFKDADIEKAVSGAVYAKYRNAGQSCIAINRFLIHQDIAADFTERLAAASRGLHVGNGLDPDTDIGSLISEKAWLNVKSLVTEAIQSGAKLVMGGFPEETKTKKLFVYPTILSGVTPDMRIVQEEIFGPVSTIQTFRSDEEALELANATSYGLASYVFTQDITRAFRIVEGLRFGMVGLNDSVLSLVQAPFGGVKESGYGREGGWQGLMEYVNTKFVAIGL